MVYDRRVAAEELTLGVSGRLLGNNLLMWDPETNSLWSQIGGEAIHGSRTGARLKQMPAVFVGFEAWKTLHPETLVLDLPPVPALSWHYTTQDLVRGRNEYHESLGIGLRSGTDTLLVPLSVLRRKKVVLSTVGRDSVVIVWVPAHACALVYDGRLAGRTPELEWRRGRLWDKQARIAYDPLSGAAEGAATPLKRYPYIPTTIPAWEDYYPGGRRVR